MNWIKRLVRRRSVEKAPDNAVAERRACRLAASTIREAARVSVPIAANAYAPDLSTQALGLNLIAVDADEHADL